MPVVSPTLLRQPPHFPRLLPKPNAPHPSPLPRKRIYSNLNAIRDLQHEMDDLSDEENELEDLVRWSIVILVGFHACIMREIFFLLKKKHKQTPIIL